MLGNQSLRSTSITEIYLSANLTKIDTGAFYDCHLLTSVYYGGSEEQWSNVSIGGSNTVLTSAGCTVYFYSEEQPTEAGNFWHYVDGVITVWPAA